jgi:hypothetical protein
MERIRRDPHLSPLGYLGPPESNLALSAFYQSCLKGVSAATPSAMFSEINVTASVKRIVGNAPLG